jgi:HEAT repeat protein
VQLSSSLTQLDAADDLRSGGAEAVPVLLDLLRDRKSIQRSTAADILGRIGPPARAAVAALRSIRDDPQDDKHLRRAAWLALRKITRSEAEPAPSEP